MKSVGKKVSAMLFASCLAVVLGVASPSVKVKAETLTDGDYKYEILEDGTAKITGYTGSVTDLTIPGTLGGYKVTVLADTSFSECKSLTKVIIPEGVTNIGDGSYGNIVNGTFGHCTSLKSVVIPSTVVSIGTAAFIECSALENINIE